MKLIKKVIIVLLAALAMVSIVQGCRNAATYSQDFQWDAAKVLTLGINPYDESLNPDNELLSLGYEEYYKQMEANQFPSLLFLLYPYTLLPPLMARYVWLASNLIFTALIIWLMRRTFFKECDKQTYAIVALLMLAGTPWRNQMGVGQHTLFALMFFLLAVYVAEFSSVSDRNGTWIVSGLLLSISYFKYTLTAPLALYFVYKRKWKELILSVVPHIILTVVASIVLKDSIINMIVKPLKVAAVLTSEGSMDIGSIIGGGNFTMIISVLLMLGLFVLTLSAKEQDNREIISLLVLWSLIITYHRSYDYFALVLIFSGLLPVITVAGDNIEKQKMSKLLLTGASALVIVVFFGLRLFHENEISIVVTAIFYYIYTLIYTYKVVRGVWRKKNVR